jgi:hypothetical protein
VFTARYALSPYIKQIRFVFKGLTHLSLTIPAMHFPSDVSVTGRNITPLYSDNTWRSPWRYSNFVTVGCKRRIEQFLTCVWEETILFQDDHDAKELLTRQRRIKIKPVAFRCSLQSVFLVVISLLYKRNDILTENAFLQDMPVSGEISALLGFYAA